MIFFITSDLPSCELLSWIVVDNDPSLSATSAVIERAEFFVYRLTTRGTLKPITCISPLHIRIMCGSKLGSALDRISPTLRPVRNSVFHDLSILGRGRSVGRRHLCWLLKFCIVDEGICQGLFAIREHVWIAFLGSAQAPILVCHSLCEIAFRSAPDLLLGQLLHPPRFQSNTPAISNASFHLARSQP